MLSLILACNCLEADQLSQTVYIPLKWIVSVAFEQSALDNKSDSVPDETSRFAAEKAAVNKNTILKKQPRHDSALTRIKAYIYDWPFTRSGHMVQNHIC